MTIEEQHKKMVHLPVQIANKLKMLRLDAINTQKLHQNEGKLKMKNQRSLLNDCLMLVNTKQKK